MTGRREQRTIRDADGRDWDVIDFYVTPSRNIKKGVALGSDRAEGRAFRPLDALADVSAVRLYWFGALRSRWPTDAELLVQLGAARPITQSEARQHWGR